MAKSISLNTDDLSTFCQNLVSEIKGKTIFLLDGPLGAGKTLLVNELVKALGGDEVSSPTYSLINTYPVSDHSIVTHVDLYRLEDEQDLESTGFWDLFSEESRIICIEWASRLDVNELPLDWHKISIKISKSPSDDTRLYKLN